MDNHLLLQRFDKELRRGVQPQGFRREETEYVLRDISLHGEKGFIAASNVDEQNARQVIQEQLDYYSNIGQEFEWKVFSYDKPENLLNILEDEGFKNDGPEALMVMEIDKDHSLLKGESAQVHEITDQQGIREIIHLEESIWDVSHEGLGERLWRDKQNKPESLFLYGVHENNRLVSAAWMYLEADSSFASLWGGSTLPEYRGKGFYTGLLAIRARKAVEMGHPILMVDASPMSKPILEKNGFHCLAYSYGLQSPKLKK